MFKKHIPNAITCANLFFGCIAIVYAFQNDLKTAIYLILLAALCDFFDGLVARWLHVKSNIGKELDSLADMVSFGVFPAVLMFQLLNQSEIFSPFVPYIGFLIAVFSALRLAKFNIDTRQTENFIGLNTPTNTLFIGSLVFIQDKFPILVLNQYFLIGITLICSYLLISEIQFFSLKLNNKGWYVNRFKLILILIAAICIPFLKFVSIPIILVFYIILSQLHFKINK